MKILIIGFARSGTTLTRRLIQSHPEIKKIYHESFLLKKYKSKKSLMMAIEKTGVDPTNNWGEKTPFYQTIRRIPVLKYCNTWNEYFGNESRILHIVRHPLDVASSLLKKRKRGTIDSILNVYSERMVTTLPVVKKLKNTFTFKYEDVLMNPDDIIPKIFDFCNLKSDIDFRKHLAKIRNKKYQTLDASRAFAYKTKKVKIKKDLRKFIEIANTIDGPKY